MTIQLGMACRKADIGEPVFEKISVSRIKIIHQAGNLTAVLGTFFSADKLLMELISQKGKRSFECRYEIHYVDGLIFKATYSYSFPGKYKPTLSQHIRDTVLSKTNTNVGKRTSAMDKKVAIYINRDIEESDPEFLLEKYDTDDFSFSG